jgi:hypothetical protein
MLSPEIHETKVSGTINYGGGRPSVTQAGFPKQWRIPVIALPSIVEKQNVPFYPNFR